MNDQALEQLAKQHASDCANDRFSEIRESDVPNIASRCLTLLRQVRDSERAEANNTCNVCNWTNSGCLNIGEANQTPFWICHGCVKRQREQLASAQQALKDGADFNAELLKECEEERNARKAAQQDKAILDWLEKFIHDQSGSLTIGFQSHDYLLKEAGGKLIGHGGELREAIAAAMSATKGKL